MFVISQLLDIPHVFRRLDELPREIGQLREQVAALQGALRDAERDYEMAQTEVLESTKATYSECKNEAQRSHFKSLLFGEDVDVLHTLEVRDEAEDRLAQRKALLLAALDEMSGLRNTVRLTTALMMGSEDAATNVLVRKLFEAVVKENKPIDLADPSLVIKGNGG